MGKTCQHLRLIFAAMVIACLSIRAASAADVNFEQTAANVFLRRCLECHQYADPNGELDLTRKDRALAGGTSGKVIVPGDAESSELLARVVAGEMPPEKNGKPQHLPAAEIQLLRDWINSGAPWPEGRVLDAYERTTDVRAGRDWWSLQPVKKPEVPTGIAAQPIDAFVRQKLVQHGLSPAPPADKRALLRRLYIDLIGLPPTAEEMDAFAADEAPDAYERQVDRLLSLPQFGERWARHWLDVARFAETNGYERDAEKPYAWKYRDWVINAINADMPYDRFVLEQLAGDELPDRTESSVIATGFIRLGTWDDEPNDPAEYQYERLEDMVHASTTAVLGLTVKCARCHDHKFDPITQTDYYRIAAAFWPGPVAHRDRKFLGGPTKDELGFDVLGWTDLTKQPKPLHALKKGDVHRPLHEVSAGALSGIPELDREFSAPSAEAKTTQRRLQLAQWMTDARNPLTPRVIVNRLWEHHFGAGLVRTPDNFGFNGQPPTHPELLDWLSSELVEGGWKLKRLHKLIVMSETYRQSSLNPRQAEFELKDSANHFWWHAERRRLDAESLRDSILATSGQLDLKVGGPSFHAPISEEALEGLSMKSGAYQASPPEETRRRSLYLYSKRGLIVPFMTTFDMCDNAVPTGRRDVTTVAPQALALLNNSWVHDQSRQFADRVCAQRPDTNARIDAAWRFAVLRSPTDSEREVARAHLEAQRKNLPVQNSELLPWVSLCHVLLNTNEFIYVD